MNAKRVTDSVAEPVIFRGAPGRGSSNKPSSRWLTNRARQRPTVWRVTRSRRATGSFGRPSAQAKIIRARCASACAVHLLQAGVELNLIRSWLGHVSLETTQRYAEIDLAQKRRALDAVTPVGTPGRRQAATWRRKESILTWLERL